MPPPDSYTRDFQSIEDDPYARIEQASTVFFFRLVLFVMSVGFAVFIAFSVKEDLIFALGSPERPVDLGDLKERWLSEKPDLGGRHNTWVSMEGVVPTRALTTEGHTYVFCPLYDVVIRTSQPLPTPPERLQDVNLDPRFLGLVQARKAFPKNLVVDFKVRGRLMRLDKVPKRYRRIAVSYREFIESGDLGKAWFLMGGARPSDYMSVLWILAGAASVVLLTGFFALRALRRRNALRDAIRHL